MKATELRIGNIIYNTVADRNTAIIADQYSIQYAHLYKPIPLTEQWLKDFGFEKKFIDNDEGRYYDYELNEFHIHGLSNNHFIFLMRKINYVHQLQNLYFALTEKELAK